MCIAALMKVVFINHCNWQVQCLKFIKTNTFNSFVSSLFAKVKNMSFHPVDLAINLELFILIVAVISFWLLSVVAVAVNARIMYISSPSVQFYRSEFMNASKRFCEVYTLWLKTQYLVHYKQKIKWIQKISFQKLISL